MFNQFSLPKMSLPRLSFRIRLIGGFTLVLLLMLAVTAVAVMNMNAAKTSNQEFVGHHWQHAANAYELINNINLVEASLLELLIAQDSARIDELKQQISKRSAQTAELLKQLKYFARSENETAIIDKLLSLQTVLNNSIALIETTLATTGAKDAVTIVNTQTLRVRTVYATKVGELIDLVKLQVNTEAETTKISVDRNLQNIILLASAALIIGLIACTLISYQLLNVLGGEPATACNFAHQLAIGNLTEALEMKSQNAHSLFAVLNQMRAQLILRLEHESQQAREMLRIKVALDNASTAVMITDSQRKIIYANASACALVAQAQDDFAGIVPQFRADKLHGKVFDHLHPQLAEHAQGLSDTNETVHLQLTLGNHHIQVAASPVIDNEGTYVGVVSEWRDRSSELSIESEVSCIVNAAANGDLSQRINLQDKTGFFASLSSGVNQLLDVTEEALRLTSDVLNGLANGNLTRTITAELNGTFGALKADTNETIAQLQSIVTKIKTAAESIDSHAEDIVQGNADLASRTEENVNSLQTTTATMVKLSSTVTQNAEMAARTKVLVSDSNKVVLNSSELVKLAVSSMLAIQESAKKIEEITSVIDRIAFQTNLLALNAAVEAARAGEQGRGFAVVAQEVRNLAQHSAKAAREIKSLIAESSNNVNEGASLINQTGVTMNTLVANFQLVATLIKDIANASAEQSVDINNVSRAIDQINGLTQQNSELVEQSAAGADEMKQQTRELKEAVSIFVLKSA